MLNFQACPLVHTTKFALESLCLFEDKDGESPFLQLINRDFVFRFISRIEMAYLPSSQVMYHNALHATDVVSSSESFLSQI